MFDFWLSRVNPKDPGRFRGETNKPDQQTCSFKINNNDQLCNAFVKKTVINNETNLDGIHFEIREVKSRLKKNNETFDAKTELDNLIQNGSGNVRVSKGRGTNSAGDISKRNRWSKWARPKCLVKRQWWW